MKNEDTHTYFIHKNSSKRMILCIPREGESNDQRKKNIYIFFCILYADKLLYQLYQVAIKIDHLHFFMMMNFNELNRVLVCIMVVLNSV